MMKKRKLNYCFHNPNTVEETADYLLKILIEANKGKVEKAVQAVVIEKTDGERSKLASGT